MCFCTKTLFVKLMSKFIKMVDGNIIYEKIILLISHHANINFTKFPRNQLKFKIKKQIHERL